MSRMKDLIIDALNEAAEAEQRAYDEYFNSATNEEEEFALSVYIFDPEDEEYLEAEDERGFYP